MKTITKRSARILELWPFVVLLYFAIFPQKAFFSTADAMEFSANRLVPSLFVFLVLSRTMVSSALMEKISKKTGIAPFLFVLGTVCGFPVGAVWAKELFDRRAADKKTAEFLIAISNNASLSFVNGFLGAELFGSTKTGFFLLAIQWTICAATSVLMKRSMLGKKPIFSPSLTQGQRVSVADSVREGGITMLTVCSCVIFFSVLGSAAARFFCGSVWKTAVIGIFEFSTGCKEAAKMGASGLPLCGFFVGFAGISVAAQIKSCVGKSLSVAPCIALKTAQGALMALVIRLWQMIN